MKTIIADVHSFRTDILGHATPSAVTPLNFRRMGGVPFWSAPLAAIKPPPRQITPPAEALITKSPLASLLNKPLILAVISIRRRLIPASTDGSGNADWNA